MHFFQNAFFLLTFSQYCGVFMEKNFFFLNPKWRLVSRLSVLNHLIFKKSSASKYKNKIFNGFTKDTYSKKIINWSSSEKIQYGAENQDGCEFRISVKILLAQHGYMIEFTVLILYFRRLQLLKHEKRKKKLL
jgi:hypothetical protein